MCGYRAFTMVLMLFGIVTAFCYVATYALVYREFKKLPTMMKFRLSRTVRRFVIYALDEFLLHHDDHIARHQDYLLLGVQVFRLEI